MTQPSITGTESFQFRAQRSEETRVAIMAGAFAAALIGICLRRALGGSVMTTNAIFYPGAAILVAATLYELFVLWRTRLASKHHRLISPWRWHANAILELIVPAAILFLNHLYSPRGEYAAISGPSILLFPIVIALSILRLRPVFTFWIGAGAAALHWAIVARSISLGAIPHGHIPATLTYGVLLVITGLAAAGVSRAVRRYVMEAVDEATELERAGRRLASMERDMDVAREIQSGLLPESSPEFRGFDIAGMNRPADKTGGDYYDWQPLPDGRLLIVMADVTGHGIGPALVMAVCRAISRASAPLDSSPASLLTRLNALLCTDLRGGRFITLAMALVDPHGHVELVSAGHGPTILVRAKDHHTEKFGGDGLPLAVDPGETYGPARALTLEHNDALVMLTDGVFEWPDRHGRQFGTERLSKVIAAASDQPAAQIVRLIDQAVRDFAAGSPQLDDFTIVVIKRTAVS